ncbi:MAG: ADP-glyceromanno-heptose 6-epimerase [Bdellovibrionaceae bacterium]|nr:ADP-glyceromanno-heptose 6-epimerase [Pseudobdellovibrionaceae bacterium]
MFIVTGANGFIGSQMVQKLNECNIENIICVDHISPAERPQPLKGARYNSFIKPDSLFDFIKSKATEIQCIFHMGACSDTQELDISFLNKNNTEYTNQLFEICTKYRNCTLIYASSGAVYGQGDQGFSDNTDPENLMPLNPYGWSKLNTDRWALEQPRQPERWYGLRFFNVYGPNEYHKKNMRSVVHKAYHQIKDTGRLKLFKSLHPQYEDGKQMRDFIYVKDVVDWMWQLYNSKHVLPGIYNMGYGRARTWLDLANAIFENMQRPINIEWIDIPNDLKERYQYFTEAKMKKFLSQAMPSPRWSLEEGVEDYIKNYLDKGDSDDGTIG